MLPTILKIGPLTIKAYGLLIAIGFLAGLNYARSQAKKFDIPENTLLDLSLYILVTGIIGGRILYVLLNWSFYMQNPAEIFKIWSGGLVFYGGFLAAVAFVIIYARIKKINVLKTGDLLAPALFLGLAIGRIGCLCAGCCYGKETTLPWGIVFSNGASLAPLGVKLHPAQAYESLFSFCLFIFLHLLNGANLKKNIYAAGTNFFTGILAYSVFRFMVEFLRGDDRGMMIFGLYPSQSVSVLTAAISIVTIIIINKKNAL